LIDLLNKESLIKSFLKKKNNKLYFSLDNYIRDELLKLGVKNIEIIKKDTYILSNNLFSARRSIKNKINDYGRNISVIMIK
tara:strand:+ start:446 stop:688 length:243 start_codon:yes stop_codon:yes gene_type:complete